MDGLSMTVRPGEIVAFLEPDGAGKSTTIDMLLGLLTPDAGEVRLFGGDPSAAVAAGRVAAVLQNGGLLRDVAVRETVELFASLFTSSRPVDEVMVLPPAARMVRRRGGDRRGGRAHAHRAGVGERGSFPGAAGPERRGGVGAR